MADLTEASQHLSQRLFGDFLQGAALGSEISALESSMATYEASILESIPFRQTSSTELPEFVEGEEPDSPNLALMCVDYFKNLALKLKLQERLTHLSSDLSHFAVGRTVTIKPIEEDSGIISETYFDGSVFYGSRRYLTSSHKPREAVGTIGEVRPADNILRIAPARRTRAHNEGGYYEFPVIDVGGNPLISVKLREPNLRDTRAKYTPIALIDRITRGGLRGA